MSITSDVITIEQKEHDRLLWLFTVAWRFYENQSEEALEDIVYITKILGEWYDGKATGAGVRMAQERVRKSVCPYFNSVGCTALKKNDKK